MYDLCVRTSTNREDASAFNDGRYELRQAFTSDTVDSVCQSVRAHQRGFLLCKGSGGVEADEVEVGRGVVMDRIVHEITVFAEEELVVLASGWEGVAAGGRSVHSTGCGLETIDGGGGGGLLAQSRFDPVEEFWNIISSNTRIFVIWAHHWERQD